ncbi:hypothetical protein OG429_12505 [Streptomyces sp. NBC_00190]|uniref:hypothetical protein n=1 Tax=unclassified Streptomyces TaxID=2593676 RepID=UPI002E2CF9DA|nr:hypothetical protein [Streptomyces sp. NBC_00190]WSZ40095.1 hypothetical protein OG239_15520 [Streptomyces sp. NBC_00868]
MKIKGFKFFCGECRYRTSLTKQSKALEDIQDHYDRKHSGNYPPEFLYAAKVKRGLFG